MLKKLYIQYNFLATTNKKKSYCHQLGFGKKKKKKIGLKIYFYLKLLIKKNLNNKKNRKL